MRYQQLSGEQLPDFIRLIAVVNGLQGSVRNLVLLNLDSASSFGDLDSLLARSVDIDQHEPRLTQHVCQSLQRQARINRQRERQRVKSQLRAAA